MENYVGKHMPKEEAESVYDEIYAELFGRENRMRKFERTHYVRNDGKSIMKGKNRSYIPRRDREWEIDDRRPKYKKIGEGTMRRYRTELAESVRRNDYDAELCPHEHRVGETTLAMKIKRKYVEMVKVADDFCKQNGYMWGELYAYDPNDHYYHVDYPMEYYRLRSEYMALDTERDRKFQKKLDRGNEHMRTFEALNEWLKYA